MRAEVTPLNKNPKVPQPVKEEREVSQSLDSAPCPRLIWGTRSETTLRPMMRNLRLCNRGKSQPEGQGWSRKCLLGVTPTTKRYSTLSWRTWRAMGVRRSQTTTRTTGSALFRAGMTCSIRALLAIKEAKIKKGLWASPQASHLSGVKTYQVSILRRTW